MAQLTIHGVPGTFHVDVSPDDENFDTVATELQKRAQSGEFDDAFIKAGAMAPPTKFVPTPQIGDALAAAKPEEPEVPDYGGFASPPSEAHLVAPAPLVPEPTGIPFPGHAAMPGVPLGGPGGVASKRMASLAPAGPQGQGYPGDPPARHARPPRGPPSRGPRQHPDCPW